MKAPIRRPQISKDEAADPESLRRILNDFMLDASERIEALESVKGITVLDDVRFEIGATYGAGSAPFDGRLRVACPDFTPTGLLLLRIERVAPAGQPTMSAAACDVKWRVLSGPKQGSVMVIDFVTGLATNSAYLMRLGVSRA